VLRAATRPPVSELLANAWWAAELLAATADVVLLPPTTALLVPTFNRELPLDKSVDFLLVVPATEPTDLIVVVGVLRVFAVSLTADDTVAFLSTLLLAVEETETDVLASFGFEILLPVLLPVCCCCCCCGSVSRGRELFSCSLALLRLLISPEFDLKQTIHYYSLLIYNINYYK
jgi:hypothetical protein